MADISALMTWTLRFSCVLHWTTLIHNFFSSFRILSAAIVIAFMWASYARIMHSRVNSLWTNLNFNGVENWRRKGRMNHTKSLSREENSIFTNCLFFPSSRSLNLSLLTLVRFSRYNFSREKEIISLPSAAFVVAPSNLLCVSISHIISHNEAMRWWQKWPSIEINWTRMRNIPSVMFSSSGDRRLLSCNSHLSHSPYRVQISN